MPADLFSPQHPELIMFCWSLHLVSSLGRRHLREYIITVNGRVSRFENDHYTKHFNKANNPVPLMISHNAVYMVPNGAESLTQAVSHTIDLYRIQTSFLFKQPLKDQICTTED